MGTDNGGTSGRLARQLRRHFTAGIVIVLPLILTTYIISWVLVRVDDILQPVLKDIVGRELPGIGLIAIVAIIFLIGLAASFTPGRRLIRYGEIVMERIPVVWHIYSGLKQVLESILAPNKSGFVQVVILEYPRKGIMSVGFVTNEFRNSAGRKMYNVFMPTVPNPTTGYVHIVPESEIIPTNMSVHDAAKLFFSAGKFSPGDTDKPPDKPV